MANSTVSDYMEKRKKRMHETEPVMDETVRKNREGVEAYLEKKAEGR